MTTMTTSSQEALYGPMLTSSQQYRQELDLLEGATDDEMLALIPSIKQGNQQARDRFIERGLGYVQYWARKFFILYHWDLRCLEYQELIGVGNLALVEYLDQAVQVENPISYLHSKAKFAMREYCGRGGGSVIATPHNRCSPHRVESLDEPLGESDGFTLADAISEPPPDVWYGSLGISDEAIYASLAYVTEKQRALLCRLYGLGGTDKARIVDLVKEGSAKKWATIAKLRDNALQTLRPILEASSQDLYTLDEVCRLLNVPQQTVSRLVRRGKITRVAYGLYLKQEVDALIGQVKGKGQGKRPQEAA